MHTAVVTLFEGDYHHGLAALVNSLIGQGYQGAVYAGYRGRLPAWAEGAKTGVYPQWPDCRSVQVSDTVQLHFLPLDTTYHFTNYKPDFMLKVVSELTGTPEKLFYFDPDIVVTAPWTFFEGWAGHGVALCEDVNSPLSEHHPRRMAWRKYFGENGISLRFKNIIYANGGFVGLQKKDFGFLNAWKNIQEVMAPCIGGLNRSSLTGTPLPEEAQGPYAPFGKTDQDALNAAVEAWDGIVSFMGKEGMGFMPGVPVALHALGQPKPWNKNFITSALKGRAPSQVEREYWYVMKKPISGFADSRIRLKQTSLLAASLIGRFYHRRG